MRSLSRRIPASMSLHTADLLILWGDGILRHPACRPDPAPSQAVSRQPGLVPGILQPGFLLKAGIDADLRPGQPQPFRSRNAAGPAFPDPSRAGQADPLHARGHLGRGRGHPARFADLRRHFGVELREDDPLQIFIPVGFAHGFLVLSDTAEVQYKCSNVYNAATESGIAWDDPDLAVAWPFRASIRSFPIGIGRTRASGNSRLPWAAKTYASGIVAVTRLPPPTRPRPHGLPPGSPLWVSSCSRSCVRWTR